MTKTPYPLILLLYSGLLHVTYANNVNLQPSAAVQEQPEGEDFSIFCNFNGTNYVQWFDPQNKPISDDRAGVVFIENKLGMLQLVFQPVMKQYTGTYTCVAIGHPEQRRSFNLSVMKPIEFLVGSRQYYATIGSNQTLFCEADTGNWDNTIQWKFKGQIIVEGKEYIKLKDGLLVMNVTEEKLGEYTCATFWSTNNTSHTKSVNIALHKPVPTTFLPTYVNNTVHGIFNDTVAIKCAVTSVPSADIRWIRNNKDESYITVNYNAQITTAENESILKMNLTSKDMLGEYTCKAVNKFYAISTNFTLEAHELPPVPQIRYRDVVMTTFLFDIESNNTQSISNYRVLYAKQDSSEWLKDDFQTEKSITDPYAINQLEVNTTYVFRVAACIAQDLCAYSDQPIVLHIPAPVGDSALTIHKIITPFVVFLTMVLLYVV